MGSTKNPIILLSGVPAAGKSTLAEHLAQRFPYAVRIPVDNIRGWIRSGNADKLGEWNEEMEAQFKLARTVAAQSAELYASAGYAVMVDDVLFPKDAELHYGPLTKRFTILKVFLRPSLPTALARNGKRKWQDFDFSQLNPVIESVHGRFAQLDMATFGWRTIDNTDEAIEETAERIMALL